MEFACKVKADRRDFSTSFGSETVSATAEQRFHRVSATTDKQCFPTVPATAEQRFRRQQNSVVDSSWKNATVTCKTAD